MATLDENILDDERLEILSDFSDPDFTENGRDYWEHYHYVVEPGHVLLRIDKYLVERIKGTSRNRIQNAAEAQCIRVNGRAVKSNYRVHPGDEISVVMDRPRYENEIIAQDIPLNIVYEDDDLLVVNKPAGMCVHPGHGNYDGTLVNALAWHFKDNPNYDVTDPRMGLVHRIDKDTSGLLVVAKTPNAKTSLGLQFFNKTTKRQYIAVVWGAMKQMDGTIEGNIGRSLRDRLQMAVFPEGDQGKHAVTHYHTIENLNHVAVVQCQLETGRTHQIRVHMRHIGHPLFNDERYGGDKICPVHPQLLQAVPTPGAPRQDAGLRPPHHRPADGFRQRPPRRHGRTNPPLGRVCCKQQKLSVKLTYFLLFLCNSR